MTKNEWCNLIILSKSDPKLAGAILTGTVNEFVTINNPSERYGSFNLIKPTVFTAEVEVIKKYFPKNGGIRGRKLKRGSIIKPKNYKVIDYFPRRLSIEKWYGLSIWKIRNILRNHGGKLLKKTPVDGLWELKIPNFRLRFIKCSDLYHCRVQIKYKLSNTKNELFNMAFNNADRYPKKGKYVNFIDFTVDKKPEEILWYLTKIIKQWNCKR